MGLKLLSKSKPWLAVCLLLGTAYAARAKTPQLPYQLSDTVNVLYGTQQIDFITAAVSGLNGDFVKNVPNFNRRNTLTGLIPGLTVMQNNGEPGDEGGSIFLRGQRTLNGNNTPWVLVDGIQRSLDMLEPNEIESITVLKDAAATAIYGMRGSNGVILITTKRGQANQKLRINLDARTGIQSPTRMPGYLGSYEYAKLYNEALINDGRSTFYSPADLEAYSTGSNPYTHPDVNWMDSYLKKYSVQQKYSLSATGGSSVAKYFFLVGYSKNSGIYKVDKDANAYNTNADMQQYSARSNVDVQVNRNFSISMDIAGRMQKRNFPGMRANSVSGIFNALSKLPPNAFPDRYEGEYSIENSDETVVNPIAGTTQHTNNPYGLLNSSGYSAYTATSFFSTLSGRYKLDFITTGLAVNASFSHDSNYNKNVNRSKTFQVYELTDLENKVVRQIGAPGKMGSVWTPISSQSRMDLHAGLDYSRWFGSHHIDAMAKYTYNRYQVNGNNLPNTQLGAIGKVNYSFDRRYVAEFSFSYVGTEQFPKDKRFGFFPSASIAWNIANEPFVRNAKWLDVLKIRASHGLTGSDRGMPYFYYLENYGQRGSISLGTSGAAAGNTAWYKAMVPNTNITWEKSRKSNIGLDAAFFDGKLTFTADIFKEYSYDILVEAQTIPSLFGGLVPNLNRGEVDNKGLEFSLGYSGAAKDFTYFAYANVSMTKSKIVNMEEQYRDYEYRYLTGHLIGTQVGLIAEGFFKDQADIDASADQSYYGTIRPGDIKYRDMNDDGKINDNDISRIGKGEMPKIGYGLTLGFSYKGLDFSALLQGVARSENFISGFLAYEFPDNGNVMPHHRERWAYYTDPVSGEIIDTRANATYPRLSLSETNNNRQNSTFWLKDLSYLRLKTVEIGYSFDNLLRNTFISQLRIYASGYNLLTFSKQDNVDPEMATSGFAYPIQKVFNVGVNITF